MKTDQLNRKVEPSTKRCIFNVSQTTESDQYVCDIRRINHFTDF